MVKNYSEYLVKVPTRFLYSFVNIKLFPGGNVHQQIQKNTICNFSQRTKSSIFLLNYFKTVKTFLNYFVMDRIVFTPLFYSQRMKITLKSQ